MKRYSIETIEIGRYTVPKIKEVELRACPKYGDFIAETGQLFSKSESEHVLKTREEAETKLAEIWKSLIG